MNVLVFNCGSSSLKYKLLSMPSEQSLAGGEAQRIGPKTAEPSRIYHNSPEGSSTVFAEMRSHQEAFAEVMKLLSADPRLRPDVVGHRVVHGGQFFKKPTVMDGSTMLKLESINGLAPIHNPPAVDLIKACAHLSPGLPQVAVFDTAYHATIPRRAAVYPIPASVTKQLGIRKYGFHGTSHRFVAEEAAKFLRKPLCRLNAVSCHLGSGGASLCAISRGQSVDNTMGYSPLQGLVMSTRSGDVDPTVPLKLMIDGGGGPDEAERLLNRRSGVLGLSGASADIRDIVAKVESGAATAQDRRTLEVYVWRIRKYLGAYLTVVGKVDAVIFTDTIGESVPYLRLAIASGFEYFGMRPDVERNAALRSVADLPGDFAAADSPVKLLAIATNEELAIARRTCERLGEPCAT